MLEDPDKQIVCPIPTPHECDKGTITMRNRENKFVIKLIQKIHKNRIYSKCPTNPTNLPTNLPK